MKTKKLLFFGTVTLALLAGCGKLEKGTSTISPSQTGKDQVVTTGQLDASTYQALLVEGKYQTSKIRGVTATNLNSNYNAVNFEKGLLELAKPDFSTAKFYFQEGQQIERPFMVQLISRQGSEAEKGLNPTTGPLVFQQVLEYDFIEMESKQLGGISLGIALNQIDYSGEAPVTIEASTIEAEGKRIAAELLAQVRLLKGLEKIPVTIGLFKQTAADDIAGGSYFAVANSKNGKPLGEWRDVNEEHITLPVAEGTKNSATEDGLGNKYNDFKSTVQSFFPNSSGFSGSADYRNNELVKLTVVIETKYFSETELLNYTQFIGQTAATVFAAESYVEVQINTLRGPKGLIQKKPGSEQVDVSVLN